MELLVDECEFFQQQVTYLRHIISADGMKSTEGRANAIVTIPTPETRFVHYDSSRPITLAAYAYGIGAIISQCDPDGSEEPIALASKTLTSTEKN